MHKEKNEIQDIYTDEKLLGTDNAWSEKDKVETKKENNIIGKTFARLLISHTNITFFKSWFFFKFVKTSFNFIFLRRILLLGVLLSIKGTPIKPEKIAIATIYFNKSMLLRLKNIGKPSEKNNPKRIENSLIALSFVLKK